MALPVIDAPKYHVDIPGIGSVMYRPFIVREQKQLLMAVDGDAAQQNQAMADIIKACTFGKIDVDNIPAYDAEYLFLQIRSRSIGENVALTLTCSSCEKTQEGNLDLTQVGVTRPEGHDYNIELGNKVLLKMVDPNMGTMDNLRRDNTPDAVIELIARSIQSIWEGDTMYAAKDYTLAELIEFVENLNPQDFDRLQAFFETLPVLHHDIEFDCKHCGAHNIATLEGLASFFV